MVIGPSNLSLLATSTSLTEQSSVARALAESNKKPPVSEILYLLHAFHEDTAERSKTFGTQAVHISRAAEKNQEEALLRIEAQVATQVGLSNSYQNVQLGSILSKVITAVMATFAVNTARKVDSHFLTGLAATGALLSAADALIQVAGYLQGTSQDAIGTVENTLNRILEEYTGLVLPNTALDYLATIRHLLTMGILLTSAVYPKSIAQMVYRWASVALSVGRSAQEAQIGQTEKELADINAEQKALQIFQDLLKQLLMDQLKMLGTSTQTLEEYIRQICETLAKMTATSRTIMRNSL